MALGARSGQVLRLVALNALKPVAAGLVLGSAGAFFAGRLLGTLLFRVQPGDPLVLAAIAATLAASAIFASLLPARRASHVDPIAVLKNE
jgi:ABC-type antimicrobial peptide transport system permease subunit